MAETCKCCGKELIPACTVPGCKAHVDVYSRPCGYLTSTSRWNDGKQEEFKDRAEYETWNSAKIKMEKDVT
jgi:ribonucleoside-triphosphate reductase